MAYAVEVCTGNSPADVSFNQKQMQSHLYTCLLDGVMSPFPKMHENFYLAQLIDHYISKSTVYESYQRSTIPLRLSAKAVNN